MPAGLLHRAAGWGDTHLWVEAGMEEPGSVHRREGGEACGWRPGGPPRRCGQGEGAFLVAAMSTHLSLQHGLNHPDRKTPNSGLG